MPVSRVSWSRDFHAITFFFVFFKTRKLFFQNDSGVNTGVKALGRPMTPQLH